MFEFERNIENFIYSSRHWRQKVLYPILPLFAKIGVTANHLSILRMLLGIIAFPIFFYGYTTLSVSLIVIALITDTIDGSVARFQKNESDRGKFVDMLADHTLYVFSIAILFYLEVNNILLASHLILVPVVYVLAIIKKQEGKKSDWIITPQAELSYIKFVGYVLFFAEVLSVSSRAVTEIGFVLLNTLMFALSGFYFSTIYKRWFEK